MESACVYEQNTVINELTQGIEMAKKLRFNTNSAEAREFLIQKILSSYENALSALKSGHSSGQPRAAALPAPSLPSQCGEFQFDQIDLPFIYQQDQNVVSRKRKELSTFETTSNEKRTCSNGAHYMTAAPPRPPPSPEKHEIKPTHQYNELSLPNLRANPSTVNTFDFDATIPYSFSLPSEQFGLMEDYQQLQFPSNFYEEQLQVCSPPFISPDSSESNYFTDWGSTPSYDFPADPADVFPDFIFDNSFF